MTRQTLLQQIESAGLIAILRADRSEGLLETCRAFCDGGVTVAEITLTTPGALEAIAAVHTELGDRALIGAGSVIDVPSAERAIAAGAQFLVSPTFKPAVVDAAHSAGIPAMPGALTPTEILTAFEYGADVVKVFPAHHFGPQYFRDLLAPLPQLRLTPTGGVDLENLAEWFAAGAMCVGVGSSLAKKDWIARGDWPALQAQAQKFTAALAAARPPRPAAP